MDPGPVIFGSPPKRFDARLSGNGMNGAVRSNSLDTLYGMLRSQAATCAPDALAMLSAGCRPLSYHRLHEHVERVARYLNALGIRRNDRVAIVLPNGPQAATAFLAVSSVATAAPLNPNYRPREFDFYFSDLEIKALIVQAGIDSPAIAIAEARNIPVIKIVQDPSADSGIFRCLPDILDLPTTADWAQRSDTALVLHTSGTTSRPKIVPLTHANLSAATSAIRGWLSLSPDDRCINIMPLFHIHGLSAMLSTLAGGGQVFCATSFTGRDFWNWASIARPTWFTAAPAMHQEVLSRFRGNESWLKKNPFRFTRSASSAMPPATSRSIEAIFHAPHIEAYGMTEAGPQIASNPLPPRDRRLGSVGLPAGPEVAIVDPEGRFLSAEQTGEIVIRGENVIGAYHNDPHANATAFINGWLRTGDLGRLDADGYLYVAGRIKELINRGGEKISPVEVDNVLMSHPAVERALTFPMPDKRLGEEVAAAIVLRHDMTASEDDLTVFSSQRLADFKVPRRIVFLEEMPLGPTGKPCRNKLAEELGLASVRDQAQPTFTEPGTSVEKRLAAIWSDVLKIPTVGRDDNFFDLGGDSLLAADLALRVEKTFAVIIPTATLFSHPTIRRLARFLDDRKQLLHAESFVTLQPAGTKAPLFLLPGIGGHVIGLRDLANLVGVDRPIHGIELRGLDGWHEPYRHIEEMAAYAISAIRQVAPHGPYHLAGFSAGGLIAFEIAQQLIDVNETVGILAMLDTSGPGYPVVLPLVIRLVLHFKVLAHGGFGHGIRYIGQRFAALARRIRRAIHPTSSSATNLTSSAQVVIDRVSDAFREAKKHYQFRPYPGAIALFNATEKEQYLGTVRDDRTMGWGSVARDGVEIIDVPGTHLQIVGYPVVSIVAAELRNRMNRFEAESLQRSSPETMPARSKETVAR